MAGTRWTIAGPDGKTDEKRFFRSEEDAQYFLDEMERAYNANPNLGMLGILPDPASLTVVRRPPK